MPDLAMTSPECSISGLIATDLSPDDRIYSGNSTTPISRLPNELLSRIMLMVCQYSRYFSDARLYLSWVCMHWRNIVIEDPQLWCKIKNIPYKPTIGLKHVQECFHRSKMLDLDVEIDWSRDHNEFLKLCMSEIHRIRSLVHTPPSRTITLDMAIHCFQESRGRLEAFWGHPAPRLSSLVLKETLLAPAPFDGVYPELKELKLVKCGFYWRFPLSISTLTALHVVFPGGRIPVDQLVAQVAAMPSLSELYLRACLDNADAPGTEQYPLPSLRSLYLDDNQAQVFAFFQMVDTPALSSLRACIQMVTFGDQELSTTLNFCKKLHPSVWTNIHHLILRPSSIEAGSSSSTSGPMDIMMFYFQTSRYPHLQVDRIPIAHLERLSIGGRFKTIPGITDSLSSLRCVKHIRFGAIKEKVVFGFLAHAHMGGISLPSLEEIHCKCDSVSEATVLLGALKRRREILQRRLPRLIFEQPGVYMDMFGGDADVVDFVDSDGVISVELMEKVDREPEW